MLAGSLAGAGYFMGEYPDYISPSLSNPKGFYEDWQVNEINEDIILAADGSSDLDYGQHWLVELPTRPRFAPTDWDRERIEGLTSRRPFCFKDPRFSYTLPVWQPYAEDGVYLCTFRHPSQTANSIMRECQVEPYLSNVAMTFERAVRIWVATYESVLAFIESGMSIFTIHYDSIISGSAVPRLEHLLSVQLDRSFADAKLSRSSPSGQCGRAADDVYRRLCQVAGPGFGPE